MDHKEFSSKGGKAAAKKGKEWLKARAEKGAAARWDEPINQVQLIERSDGIKAIEVRVQVPAGLDWEPIGLKLLSTGSHMVNQAVIDNAK